MYRLLYDKEMKKKKSFVLHAFFHYNCFDRWALILLGGPMQEITPFSLDDLHKTECIRVQKRHTIEAACFEKKKCMRYEKFLVITVVWVNECECVYEELCMCLKCFGYFFFSRKRTWTTHELITCTYTIHIREPHGWT